ncbi:2-hydroxyacid dehydrogenase [Pantoea sp. JGM49]|jgi:Lactate dehydrogenase and related dehydrogenases|uniref:2-hydroxyacid dehydrogenase n=1 Tax=unclassified Pantoea TaxID=2630326 RepID=UPI001BAD8958|nr:MULTISPECIES: 2-hydroxyacid dehydrogenase [unclassified Pantoea]MBS0881401.1 2-hydroxyacid dehydrogenase [Pantoea sp. JGM49]MDI9278711.1 2-hydroxyacid dehydrogenase [Pantoea sp. EABMAA-21]
MMSSQPHILIIQPLMPQLDEKLSQHFHCHRLYNEQDPALFLQRQGKEIQGIVTRGDVGVETSILEQVPACKAIAVFGVGTDRIDLNYTAAHDIQVSITSDILTDDVADLAMTLTLAFSRNLVANHQFARSGAWENTATSLSSKASGKRMGIAGLGAIGLAIARRAEAFGMEIAYTARSQKDVPYQRCENIEQLAAFSDFLVLALPGSPENIQLVDAKVLAALGKSGVLINIARGTVVNENDLIQALQQGVIKGAALDVFPQEPIIHPALRELDNVLLTPHIASATHETREGMANNVLENLLAYFSNGKMLTTI